MVNQVRGQSQLHACIVLMHHAWLCALSTVFIKLMKVLYCILKTFVLDVVIAFYACPFGAPQFPQAGNYGSRGKMDKCTFCAGGPEADMSELEFQKYGRNRLAEGKVTFMCRNVFNQSIISWRWRRSSKYF
jgi:hypothetical protein